MVNFSKDKTTKYLILGVLVISVLMLAQKFFLSAGPIVIQDLPLVLPKISLKITDIEKIGSSGFSEDQANSANPFDTIALPANVGRDNPFAPYPLVEAAPTTTPLEAMPLAGSTAATTTIP